MSASSTMPLDRSCQHRNGDVSVLMLNALHSTLALHLTAQASTVSVAVLLILFLFPRRCVSGPRNRCTKQSPGCVVVVTVVIVAVVDDTVAVVLVDVTVVDVNDVVVVVVVVRDVVVVEVVQASPTPSPSESTCNWFARFTQLSQRSPVRSESLSSPQGPQVARAR